MLLRSGVVFILSFLTFGMSLGNVLMCQNASIKPIALSQPGMSQTWMYYQLVNQGKTPCRLVARQPRVKAVFDHEQTASLSKGKKSKSFITLKPTSSLKPSANTVWFMIHADAAHMPGDPGYHPNFNQILVYLPGIDHAYRVNYSGYSSGVEVSALQSGVTGRLKAFLSEH
jgi:hypothetical protein